MVQPFNPTPKQIDGLKILTHPEIERILFDGGARSGKTVAICHWLVLRALQFPLSKQLVARLRQVDLRASGWRTFKEHLFDHFPSHLYTIKEKDFRIDFYNKSYIQFTGLDTKERMDFILGTEWLTVFINEATQSTYDALTTIMTRLSQRVGHMDDPKTLGVPKVVIDCNPKHRKHWIYVLAVRNPPIIPGSEPEQELPKEFRWTRLNWTPFDNLDNLAPSFIMTLDSLPYVKKARMKDGIWMDNEGAIYDEFDEDVHMCNPFDIPTNWVRFRGVDFGYTNPFCCLWAARDFDGRVYFYEEHYESERIVRDHCRVIKEKSMTNDYLFTVADWDAEDRETMHREGIKTVQADKRILPGIEMVKRRLRIAGDGKPRLFVMRGRCPNMVSEFYDYVWDNRAPENTVNKKEIPLDQSNHAMDTMRYMIMRLDAGPQTTQIEGIRSDKERALDFHGYLG